MEKITKYQQIILAYFHERAKSVPVNLQDVENHVIADTKNHHYLLVSIGWDDTMQSYSTIFHIEIKPNGKLYIHANNTDTDIAEDLMFEGVERSDLVAALQHPIYRPYTGYALA